MELSVGSVRCVEGTVGGHVGNQLWEVGVAAVFPLPGATPNGIVAVWYSEICVVKSSPSAMCTLRRWLCASLAVDYVPPSVMCAPRRRFSAAFWRSCMLCGKPHACLLKVSMHALGIWCKTSFRLACRCSRTLPRAWKVAG